uniref:WH1 domain-containing protein n=1 Tax=Strongyloides papillosus TaxID=174720 RepID=A0A0N5CGZ9_STREA
MSFPLNESCINYNDVHYLNLDTVVVGKGRDRIKYLDLEGRWRRSGTSCSAIANAFNHLEKLNYSTLPLSDLGECSLNAIRGPTPFSTKTTLPIKKTPIVIPTEPITVTIEQEVPPSPREIPPYRSLGYGEAHQKRRLSIPAERSRSPSLSSRNASPVPPTYDSTITKGKWSPRPSNKDLGYSSAPSSGYPSPRMQDDQELPRPPHRTQPLSPLPSPRSAYDSEYDSSYLYKASKETNESFQDIRMSLRESRRKLVYGK